MVVKPTALAQDRAPYDALGIDERVAPQDGLFNDRAGTNVAAWSEHRLGANPRGGTHHAAGREKTRTIELRVRRDIKGKGMQLSLTWRTMRDLGEAYERAGRYEEARTLYREWLAELPTTPDDADAVPNAQVLRAGLIAVEGQPHRPDFPHACGK